MPCGLRSPNGGSRSLTCLEETGPTLGPPGTVTTTGTLRARIAKASQSSTYYSAEIG